MHSLDCIALSNISHFRSGSCPRFLSHMCCESVVAFLLVSCLKEKVWAWYLFLNFSVLPMYFFGYLSFMVAWYTTFSWLQFLSRGHLSFLFFWQLQVFTFSFSSVAVLFSDRTFWLWAWIMALRFLLQLYEIFMVFLLHIPLSGCFLGKCLSTSAKKEEVGNGKYILRRKNETT